jgi:hypothetical protein
VAFNAHFWEHYEKWIRRTENKNRCFGRIMRREKLNNMLKRSRNRQGKDEKG